MSNKDSSFSVRINDLVFARAIEKCGIPLLQRKFVASMKLRKRNALDSVCNYILQESGKVVTDRQVLKKLNNMKCRLKMKLDKKSKIKSPLTHGEKLLLHLINSIKTQADVTPKGAECDDDTPSEAESNNLSPAELPGTVCNISEHSAVSLKCEVDLDIPPMQEFAAHEEDEVPAITQMSTEELQRLVLTKQLEVFEEQKTFYMNANATMDKFDRLVELQMRVYSQKL